MLLNCLSCGRIHCEIERVQDNVSGEPYPCMFCGEALVNEFGPVGNDKHDTQKSPRQQDNSLARAVEQRNRLLEFDGSASGNYVIDDQMDYYESESNKWLTSEERQQRRTIEEQLREKHGKKRGQMKLSIDFTGRVVCGMSADEEKAEIDRLKQALQRSSAQLTSSSSPSSLSSGEHSSSAHGANGVLNPEVVPPNQLKFRATGSLLGHHQPSPGSMSQWTALARARHVQHLFFEEEEEEQGREEKGDGYAANSLVEQNMSDQYDDSHIVYEEPLTTDAGDNGMCLSMHQPYASLLVHGVKRHEGRLWSTDYRGRLWIASTQQETSDEEIESLKDFYSDFSRGHLFPNDFPTGCILGCVDLVDCLSRDEYTATVPIEEQESQSDFVFMVKNPRRLFVPIPILGRPKIYKLDKETLSQCQQGLRSIDPSRIVRPPRGKNSKRRGEGRKRGKQTAEQSVKAENK